MSGQWGKSDASSNSVLWAPTSVKKTPNTTNRNALFGNTTVGAFIPGIAVGQFGVSAAEMGVGNGGVAQVIITDQGSGYAGNTTVSFSGGGGSAASANAFCNTSIGKITEVKISAAGDDYVTNPNVAIAAPAAITFNALTAVSNTNDTIAISTANAFFQAGDRLTYTVAAGNTAISGLTSGTTYYVKAANSTTLQLATTATGSVINLTAGVSETGHSLRGTTATARAVVGGMDNKAGAHAGWVLRTAGTGGRAGRVHYETLVAMGSITGDASDDTVLPDS